MKKVASVILIVVFAFASLGVPRVVVTAVLRHRGLEQAPEMIGSLAACVLIIGGLILSIRWNQRLRKSYKNPPPARA